MIFLKIRKNLIFLIALSMIISLSVGCSKEEKVEFTPKYQYDDENKFSGEGTKEVSESDKKEEHSVNDTNKVEADEAKKLLVEGNERYVSGEASNKDISITRRETLSKNGQKPFAIVVSCSDSRVPPEVVFDQALGDLFIIRDAGNVIDSVALGSIEYGAEHLKAPLIVVMGHEKCGAVKATVDGGEALGSIPSIIKKIQPSFDKVKSNTSNKEELYEKSSDENILNTINEIKKSKIIEELVEGGLKIVGAKYLMDNGKVKFLEGEVEKAKGNSSEGTSKEDNYNSEKKEANEIKTTEKSH